MGKIWVPEGVRKADLYEYIENLYNKRESKLKEEYSKSLKPMVERLLHLHDSMLNKLEDILQEIQTLDIDLLKELTKYNHGIIALNSANYYFNKSPKQIVESVLNSKAENVEELRFSETVMSEEMKEIVKAWNAVVVNYNKEISEAIKLKDELYMIVKNERRATRAYKRLVELGLDMTGFKENFKNETYVPDILRTSVDINIFNGLGDE